MKNKNQHVPEGWEIIKLGRIAKKCTIKNRNFGCSFVLTNSAQCGIVPQLEHFEKEIAIKENIDSYFVIADGDFVYNPRISVTAPCDPIRRNHTGRKGIISLLYTAFRFDNINIIFDTYLEYFFLSSTWHKHIKSIANYGARHDRMSMAVDDFFSMPIPLPPLSEQRAIADILAAVDRLISLKEQLIDAKRKQKL